MGVVTTTSSLKAPEPISAEHNTSTFNSGKPSLDNWLRERALKNDATLATRTVVVCDDTRVVGYFALAAGSVNHEVATRGIKRNMPDPVPAIVLARLAVDIEWQGRGLGKSLLREAVLRTASAAETIGARAMFLHAVDDDAKAFYLKYGFKVSPADPMTMMIPLQHIIRNLTQASTT